VSGPQITFATQSEVKRTLTGGAKSDATDPQENKDDRRCKRIAEQTGNRTREPDRLPQEC
jgi:hypothetical protein